MIAEGQPVTAAPTAVDSAYEPNTYDIVVTARRSEERLQSVPVSVTAFNADMLRESNIQKSEDLMFRTPGISLTGTSSRENSVFSIRGQSKALSGPGAAGVVSYFADVPAPTFGSGISTYDMASVQVLKGPQGTLFGRNTTGGAVLYYPTLPTYEFSGYVQGTYARFDQRQLEAAVTVPLVDDHLAIRMSGQYQKDDGFTKNVNPMYQYRLNNTNSRALRGTVLFEPVYGIKNVTIFDYYRNRYNSIGNILVDVFDDPSLLDVLGIKQAMKAELAKQRARGPYVTDVDAPPGVTRAKRLGVTNRTDIELGGSVSFTNIFGYRSTELRDRLNVDGVGLLPADGTGAVPAGLPVRLLNAGFNNEIEQYTNEVQLRGKLFGDRLSWLIGGFYLDSKPTGPTGTSADVGSVPLPGVVTGTFNYNFYSEKSRALFGSLNYDLDSVLEGLTVNGSFRYTWDKVKACTAATTGVDDSIQPGNCNATDPRIVPGSQSVNRSSSSAPTWSFGLDWQINRDLFAYIVTRRGYRAGGINSPTFGGLLEPFQSFDPETVTDAEIGIRTDWRAGQMRGRFNLSAFTGYYDKVQIALAGAQSQLGCIVGDPVFGEYPYTPDGDCNFTNDPATGTFLINAGKTRVSGIDFDGFISPVEHLTFNFGGTLLDTATRSLTVPSLLQPYVGGNKIPFNLTAKHTFTLGGDYDLPLGDIGDLAFHADFYHSGKVFYSGVFLPPYEVVNFRLDWNGVADSPVDLSVYMSNAFGAKYLQTGSAAAPSLGFYTGIYGPPRQYGVVLRYRFGS